VLSLERLGRHKEAADFAKHFAAFAETELNSDRAGRRAEAHYLLGLVEKYKGQPEQARKQMAEAIKAEPDLLQPRYELRGDALDPISGKGTGTAVSSIRSAQN
jgi:tetratricopeptide (TPR) repeat protein